MLTPEPSGVDVDVVIGDAHRTIVLHISSHLCVYMRPSPIYYSGQARELSCCQPLNHHQEFCLRSSGVTTPGVRGNNGFGTVNGTCWSLSRSVVNPHLAVIPSSGDPKAIGTMCLWSAALANHPGLQTDLTDYRGTELHTRGTLRRKMLHPIRTHPLQR